MGEMLTHFEDKEIISPKEQVVILLKPGATGYEDRLIDYLTEKELKIINRQQLTFDKEQLYNFYPHADKVILERFPEEEANEKKEEFEHIFIENEVVALLVEGEDAIEKINRLKKRVRGLLHLQRPNDGIHASDSQEEARRERGVIWPDSGNN